MTHYVISSVGSFLILDQKITEEGFFNIGAKLDKDNYPHIMQCIEAYKTGKISTSQFRFYMTDLMGLNKCSVALFDRIWNSMIDEASIAKLHDLAKRGQDEQKHVLVSSTNSLHQDFIKSRLNTDSSPQFYTDSNNGANPELAGLELFLSYLYGATNINLYDRIINKITAENKYEQTKFTIVIGNEHCTDTLQAAQLKETKEFKSWARFNGYRLIQKTTTGDKVLVDFSSRPLLLMAPMVRATASEVSATITAESSHRSSFTPANCKSSRRGLTAPTSHTTVRAMSHTAVPIKFSTV